MNKEEEILERREFRGRYPYAALFIAMLLVAILLVFAILALTAHVRIVTDEDIGKVAFLRTFGSLGLLGFGGPLVFLTPLALKRRNTAPAMLVLDKEWLSYGPFKVAWRVMRPPAVCKYFGRTYVGIRTLNDRAYVKKIDDALSKIVPWPLLMGLHYQQWRSSDARNSSAGRTRRNR